MLRKRKINMGKSTNHKHIILSIAVVIVLFFCVVISTIIYSFINSDFVITGSKLVNILEKINAIEYEYAVPEDSYTQLVHYARNDTIYLDWLDGYLEIKKRNGAWSATRLMKYSILDEYADRDDFERKKNDYNFPNDYPIPFGEEMISPNGGKKLVISYEYGPNNSYVKIIDLDKGTEIKTDIYASDVDPVFFLDNKTILRLGTSLNDSDIDYNHIKYGDLRLIFYEIDTGKSYESKVEKK